MRRGRGGRGRGGRKGQEEERGEGGEGRERAGERERCRNRGITRKMNCVFTFQKLFQLCVCALVCVLLFVMLIMFVSGHVG